MMITSPNNLMMMIRRYDDDIMVIAHWPSSPNFPTLSLSSWNDGDDMIWWHYGHCSSAKLSHVSLPSPRWYDVDDDEDDIMMMVTMLMTICYGHRYHWCDYDKIRGDHLVNIPDSLSQFADADEAGHFLQLQNVCIHSYSKDSINHLGTSQDMNSLWSY